MFAFLDVLYYELVLNTIETLFKSKLLKASLLLWDNSPTLTRQVLIVCKLLTRNIPRESQWSLLRISTLHISSHHGLLLLLGVCGHQRALEPGLLLPRDRGDLGRVLLRLPDRQVLLHQGDQDRGCNWDELIVWLSGWPENHGRWRAVRKKAFFIHNECILVHGTQGSILFVSLSVSVSLLEYWILMDWKWSVSLFWRVMK